MTSLLDIAKLESTVQVRGTGITCYGISARGVVSLIERFPALKELMFPAGVLTAPSELSDPLALVHAAPDAVAAIITAGTGHLADRKHEEAAANLAIEEQIDLLGEIMRLTLPNGLVPFMEKLTALFGVVSGDGRQVPLSAAEQQPQTSLSNGKALDTRSPSQSSA